MPAVLRNSKGIFHETRRVFDVVERLDGLQSWYVIENMPPLDNKLSLLRALVRDWHALEWEVYRSQKAGWMSYTLRTNAPMLRIYPALGARRYCEDATNEYFLKRITTPPPVECPSLATMVRRIREGDPHGKR